MGLKKATRIEEIPNSFPAAPLSGADLDIYYNETMSARTADQYSSPIEYIYEACTGLPSPDHIFLLMGHRGCGKSTELNKMAERMQKEGMLVRTVYCQRDIGSSPVYTDLLILMGEALIDMAREIGCEFDSALGKTILDFWRTEIVSLGETKDVYSLGIEAGAAVETPRIFERIFEIFGRLKTSIRFKQSDSIEYRQKIERRFGEWQQSIEAISDLITGKMEGKQPVIIFEDLDKLDNVNPDIIWDMFLKHADNLCSFSFPVIYTFPISLSYDPEFGSMHRYEVKILPLIEVEYLEGGECKEGINCIRQIVSARAEDSLFEEEAILNAIRKTGGSLRDLFRILREASARTRRRKASRVEQEDVEIALKSLCSDLTRRIETKDYDFLRSVLVPGQGRREISDKEKLLMLIKADVVQEYNSRRWHNVHPLVAEFLNEIREGAVGG